MHKLIILVSFFLAATAAPAEEVAVAESGDLIKIATEHGKLERILKAVVDLGLGDKFKSLEAVTIFAPSDEVFAKLPKGTMEALTKEQKSAIVSRLDSNYFISTFSSSCTD